MHTGVIILLIVGALALIHVVISMGPHLWRRRDRGVDSQREQGLVIFVESIRWLGVPWGKRTVAAGLRRAGYTGTFRYWRHHSTWRAWLVIPVVAAPKLLERESQQLADFIVRQRTERPGRPIWLIGYSAGGYVATRALELLPGQTCADGAAMLAPAFSPWRDLSLATGRSSGTFIVASSWLDWLILGIGTILFGTCDRKHVPSAGMIGHRGAGETRRIRWRPGLILTGNFGDHFSASATRFVAQHIAPELLGSR